MDEKNTYDHLIIGAGCAGASAGMYAARMNMKTAMIAELPGGLITTTHLVENWPGIKQISGPDLASSLLEHAMSYNVPLINERVLEITKAVPTTPEGKQSGYVVKTKSNTYFAKTVLIATGTEHKKLDAPGVERLTNKGVSYCALCDGAFFKGKTVGIVGSGDSAAKEAIFLAEHCAKVYVFVRGDRLKAEAPNMARIVKNERVEIRLKTQVTEVFGENSVEKVKLDNGEEVVLQGLFIAIGHLALSGLAKQLGVALNDKGEILISRHSETNLPGIYAAGDVTDTIFKQAITGSAEAVTAAFFAFDYLGKNEVVFE